MPNFKCLYYFYSTRLSVLEIKRTDLPDGAPLSEIYKWLVLPSDSDKVIELHFKSMDRSGSDEFREFQEGEFRFNTIEGNLYLDGIDFRLERKKVEDVTSETLEDVGSFIAG